jgi:hypothetical protein
VIFENTNKLSDRNAAMGLLVLVFLLLVAMPIFLYITGWAVKTYTEKPPQWIGFPIARDTTEVKPGNELRIRKSH